MAGNDMKYIDLLNNFWKLNAEHSFTPNEKAVYFALLYKWNDLHRKDEFNQSTEYLAANAGVSESSVQRAKKVLQEAGLIKFRAGDGRRKSTIYNLVYGNKGSHSDHLSQIKGSHTDTLSLEKGSHKGGHCDHLYEENEQKKVVTVTDNISILDIEETYSKEREGKKDIVTQKKSPVPLINTSLFSSMEDVEFVCLNESTQWQESMMRRFAITTYPEIKNWIKKFFEEMRAQGQEKRNLTDTTSHCFNWIRIQIEKEKNSAQKEKASSGHSTKGVMAGLAWGGVQRRRKQ